MEKFRFLNAIYLTVASFIILSLFGFVVCNVMLQQNKNVFALTNEANVDLSISNENEFVSFITSMNNGDDFDNEVVALSADINLTNVAQSSYASLNNSTFAGTFMGNGYSITGYKLTFGNLSCGLFANLESGASVSGLKLSTSIVLENATAYRYVGAIAGTINEDASVSNCYVDFSVSSAITNNTKKIYVGAIAGRTNELPQNVYVKGNFPALQNVYYGHFAGRDMRDGGTGSVTAVCEFGSANFSNNQENYISFISPDLNNLNENWVVQDEKPILKIMQKVITPIEPALVKDKFTYTGSAPVLEFEKLNTQDDVYIVADTSACVDVNSYEIPLTLAGKDCGNYELKINTIKFEIIQKEISISLNKTSEIYNGENQDIDFEVNGILLQDNEYVSVELTTTFIKDFGDYDLEFSITGTKKGNYKLANQELKFSVLQYEINVEWDNTNLVYNGTNQAPQAIYTLPSFANNLDFELTGLQTNKGENYIAVLSTVNNNFKINNGSCTYNINAKNIEISWDKQQKYIFNNALQSPEYIVPNESLFSGLEFVASGAGVDVGDYVAIVTLDNDNFVLQNNTCEFSIEKYELNLTWENDTLYYNGTEQTPKYNIVLPQFIDELDFVVTGGGINAGDYEAIVSLDNSNFKLSNNSYAYTINPYELNVQWEDETIYYNGAKQVPSFNINYPQFANDLDIITTGGGINVDDYEIILSLDNPNFVLKNNACSYSILPYNLSVQWQSSSFVYSAEEQLPQYYVALPNFAQNITFKPDFIGVNVGEHSSTLSVYEMDAVSANFVLENAQVKYSISPYSLVLNWTNTSTQFNGYTQKPIATIINGESFSNLPEIIVSDGQMNAGTYTATASINNTNFVLANPSCEYTITPRIVQLQCDEINITITSNNQVALTQNISIEPVTTPTILPENYRYFLGFNFSVSSNGTPFANVFNSQTDNFNVTFTLPQNLILPEDIELFLIDVTPIKLTWTKSSNVVSLTTPKLGEICFAYKVEATPPAQNPEQSPNTGNTTVGEGGNTNSNNSNTNNTQNNNVLLYSLIGGGALIAIVASILVTVFCIKRKKKINFKSNNEK